MEQSHFMSIPPLTSTRLLITRSLIRNLHMSQLYSSTKPRRRPREGEGHDVALSKALSWLLRHHLDKSGLEVRENGYVRLDELVCPFLYINQLKLPKFRQYNDSQVREVVASNDKKRFLITTFDTPDGPKDFIRANQGHSIQTIKIEMEQIMSAEEYPTIIHGTNNAAWSLIGKDPKGINKMKRNHIHFATGLLGEEGVISGMRHSCTVLIYLDLEKALKDGIKFFKSENGVILSEGLNNEGYIPKEYFKKVVTRKGEQLWPKN
jgi:2'-phosphotransferase